jgi:hypothetical protein
MLDIAVKSQAGLFDHVLSVDAVRAYKPAAAAYALGTAAFDAAPRERSSCRRTAGTPRRRWFGYTSGSTASAPPKNSASRRTAPAAAWLNQPPSRPPPPNEAAPPGQGA